MSKKLRILASLLIMGGSFIGLCAASVQAQETNNELFRPKETPQEAMEREFYTHDKSILRSRDIGGLLDPAHLIGLPRYNDNAIILDSKNINRMHRYLQEQQTYSNPTIRSADLTSPFNTSVQLLPIRTGNMTTANTTDNGMIPTSVPPNVIPVPPFVPTPGQPVEGKF
ncbi:MAG: hypothetical protein LH631_06465 [Alkalinema sp. CAN_BIN05]|nr:hypothetical protein [Alkalinema sp. CAN_BIN05]